MMVSAYLNFNGQCEEAFAFYAKCLGGKIIMLNRYAGSPAAAMMPPDHGDKIMHERLQVGDAVLMGSDSPPGLYKPMQGCSISIDIADPAQADRVFAAIADGGSIQMPIQETFWARRFGMLTDRFGIVWMVNSMKPA